MVWRRIEGRGLASRGSFRSRSATTFTRRINVRVREGSTSGERALSNVPHAVVPCLPRWLTRFGTSRAIRTGIGIALCRHLTFLLQVQPTGIVACGAEGTACSEVEFMVLKSNAAAERYRALETRAALLASWSSSVRKSIADGADTHLQRGGKKIFDIAVDGVLFDSMDTMLSWFVLDLPLERLQES